MKQLVRRIGKTIAFVLPVVLVTTGTLAVTRVPWAPPSSPDQQVLAAAAADGSIGRTAGGAPAASPARHTAPQDVLRDTVLQELRAHNPAAALDMLQRAMQEHPSLTPYCTGIARALGQATVRKYHGDVRKAQRYARPVCDGSFAAGAADGR